MSASENVLRALAKVGLASATVSLFVSMKKGLFATVPDLRVGEVREREQRDVRRDVLVDERLQVVSAAVPGVEVLADDLHALLRHR